MVGTVASVLLAVSEVESLLSLSSLESWDDSMSSLDDSLNAAADILCKEKPNGSAEDALLFEGNPFHFLDDNSLLIEEPVEEKATPPPAPSSSSMAHAPQQQQQQRWNRTAVSPAQVLSAAQPPNPYMQQYYQMVQKAMLSA